MDDKARADSALLSMEPPKGYDAWKNIAISYKAAGGDLDTFLGWCARDPEKYDEAAARKLFENVGEDGKITAGTLFWHARNAGWEDGRAPAGKPALPNDETSFQNLPYVEQAIKQIEALFEPGEFVNIQCKAAWDEKHRKWVPADGGRCFERDDLIARLREPGWGGALEGYEPEAGIWVCQNPTNGEGRGKARTTRYGVALIESDELPVDDQIRIMRELGLPIATMTLSGGKSVHALVRIDAEGPEHYADRVALLHEVCNAAGLKVDPANTDCSRLTRLAGANRRSGRQSLLYVNIGAANFSAWAAKHKVAAPVVATDEAQELNALARAASTPVQDFSQFIEDAPEPAPALIDGILREEGKMELVGELKGGKSTMLMRLMFDFSNGGEFMGHRCREAHGLYVNLEDAPSEIKQTMQAIEAATGQRIKGQYILDLRGKAAPLDELACVVIAKVNEVGPLDFIIIDPEYKVSCGDENSASDVARFTNALDTIREATHCAIIYAHHHSKGSGNYANSYNKGSGSNVFARDASCILDLSPLTVKDEMRSARKDEEEREHILLFLAGRGLEVAFPEHSGADAMRRACREAIPTQDMNELIRELDEVDRRVDHASAWKASFTLRGFEEPSPTKWWFEWPQHRPDNGTLDDAKETKNGDGNRRRALESRHEKNLAMDVAAQRCAAEGVPATRENMLGRLESVEGETVTKSMLKSWTRKDAGWSFWHIGDDGLTLERKPPLPTATPTASTSTSTEPSPGGHQGVLEGC